MTITAEGVKIAIGCVMLCFVAYGIITKMLAGEELTEEEKEQQRKMLDDLNEETDS